MDTAPSSRSINDTELIKWFQKNHPSIKFINKIEPKSPSEKIWERLDRSQSLITNIGALEDFKELQEQKEILMTIWKDLVAKAIIYLKYHDSREDNHDDGDYGIDELAKFFEEYCDFEKVLYGSSDYYRDHVSHAFRVFLLGEYLVREYLKSFSKIELMDDALIVEPSKIVNKYQGAKKVDPPKTDNISPEEKSTEYTISADEKEAMWCLMSLTHDLGYPTEIIHKIPNQMRRMLSLFNIDVSYSASQQSQYYNDFIVKLISSDLKTHEVEEQNEFGDKIRKVYHTTHTQAKYYSKFSRSLENWDHGIETCILLVKTLVYFLETELSLDEVKKLDILDARHFLIRQRILRAIASHSCNHIYHLKLDMSFLLRIVDEMQEWGRPRLSDLFSRTPSSSLEIRAFAPDKVDYAISFSYGKNQPSSMTVQKFREEIHINIKDYFKKEINTYIMILRSAVDGKNRNLVMSFNVIDEIENNKYIYKFVHEKPNIITIYFGSFTNKYVNDSLLTKIPIDVLEKKDWTSFCEEVKKQNVA